MSEVRQYRCLACKTEWECDESYEHNLKQGAPPEVECPECERKGKLVRRVVE